MALGNVLSGASRYLKGDALHALWGAEGMLLAGAAQYEILLIWPGELAVHAPSRSAVGAVGKLSS